MRIKQPAQCLNEDYHIRFLEALRMPQSTEYPAFSSMGYPKRQDMLLLVKGCTTEYETKSGKTLRTKDGDVVYVPKGSEYIVSCTSDSRDAATLQINFLLFDKDFEPFILSDEITVFSDCARLHEFFEKSTLLGKNASVTTAMQKAVLFELIDALARLNAHEGTESVISRGTDYLLAHYFEDPGISEIAEMCHVSEEYFRRLFRRQTGLSPVAYKNSLRLKKAEQYLIYSDMSIAQISEALSFSTVSHFIKMFKSTYGTPPLAYRNSKRRPR